MQKCRAVGVFVQGGFSALHIAAEEGHVHMTSLLLLRGAPAGCQSHNGLTPLHLAAQEGHLPVSQTLVEAGRARVDATTKVSRAVAKLQHILRILWKRISLATEAPSDFRLIGAI